MGAHFAVAPGWTLSAGVAPGLTDGAGSPTVRALIGLRYYAPLPAPSWRRSPSPHLHPHRRRSASRRLLARRRPHLRRHPTTTATASSTPRTPARRRPARKSEDPKKNGCPLPKDTRRRRHRRSGRRVPRRRGSAQRRPGAQRMSGGADRRRTDPDTRANPVQDRQRADPEREQLDPPGRRQGPAANTPRSTKVRVEGHTDTRGKPRHNKTLSKRGAASVVKWLVKHGIKKTRLTSAGFGQERPIATNMTDDGRHQNRRVEFHIVEGPGGEKTR